MWLCPRFMGRRRMKGICRLGFFDRGLALLIARKSKVCRKKLQASVLAEACFLEPYLTGCFPPKPPVRSLIHSDHRRVRQEQQEYRGNKRKTYISAVALPACWPHKTP